MLLVILTAAFNSGNKMIELDAYLNKIKHLIPAAAELDLEIIEGGYSNHAYLLSWEGRAQCVLRLPGLDEHTFQICRTAEKRALEQAAEQLLSPPCLYFDVVSGLMVSKYVPQAAFDWDVSHEDLNVIRLAKSLKHIHSLPTNNVAFCVNNTVSKYLECTSANLALTDERQQEVQWLTDIATPYLRKILPYHAVMCHNDLNPKNCLADEMHFWVIDWEYAGEGDPLFDIASVFASHNFTVEQKTLFFEYYPDDIPLVDLHASLENYQTLYKIRELAWMLLKSATSNVEDDLSGYYRFKETTMLE